MGVSPDLRTVSPPHRRTSYPTLIPASSEHVSIAGLLYHVRNIRGPGRLALEGRAPSPQLHFAVVSRDASKLTPHYAYPSQPCVFSSIGTPSPLPKPTPR